MLVAAAVVHAAIAGGSHGVECELVINSKLRFLFAHRHLHELASTCLFVGPGKDLWPTYQDERVLCWGLWM